MSLNCTTEYRNTSRVNINNYNGQKNKQNASFTDKSSRDVAKKPMPGGYKGETISAPTG